MELLADIVTFIKDCFDQSKIPELLVNQTSQYIAVIADWCNMLKILSWGCWKHWKLKIKCERDNTERLGKIVKALRVVFIDETGKSCLKTFTINDIQYHTDYIGWWKRSSNRSLRRLNWNTFKNIPEKAFLKVGLGRQKKTAHLFGFKVISRIWKSFQLIGGEEVKISKRSKVLDKLQRISDDLTDFTNQKEENKDRNLKLIQEIHQMQRHVMAEMITADKNINMIERKMKRRSGDLEMEVKLAKAKERLIYSIL